MPCRRLYHHVRAALNTKSTTATVVLFFSMSISGYRTKRVGTLIPIIER